MTPRPTAPSGHIDGLLPDDPAALEAPEEFDPPKASGAARGGVEGGSDTGTGTDVAEAADRAGGPAVPRARAATEGRTSPARTGDDGTRVGLAPRRGGTGALALVSRSWRQLTSMRTALILLFLLAVAAVPGSLIPQRDINPMKVEQYIADHRTLAPWLERLSAFDVFAAPWFAAVYLLLFISLIGCLWSRVRWHARALFTAPPKAPGRPGRLPGGSTWTSPLDADEAVLRARGVLRDRRFRAVVAPVGAQRPDGSADHSVAAEKGYLRETGNLVFHLALVALLAGVGLGSWFGYQGTVLVVTGNGFANTLISYDQFSGGELVDPVELPPFSLNLDGFEARYREDGQPADFRADVTYSEDRDSPAKTAEIRINHPLAIGDAKVYLIGHGYAPHFVLRDAAGAVVWESYVPCTPRDGMLTSTCTVKIPDTGLPPTGELATPQQLAFSGILTPTSKLDPGFGYVSVFPAALLPKLTLTGFVGNLHLNEGIPQNIYTVDTRDMTQLTMSGPTSGSSVAQLVTPNDPQRRTVSGLPGGLSLEVDGIREFVTFQTKSDPYKGLVLGASVVIILGLVASLRVRRRRVWVRANPVGGSGGGSTVEIGGLSRSDAQVFATELAALIRAIRDGTTPQSTQADHGGTDDDGPGSSGADLAGPDSAVVGTAASTTPESNAVEPRATGSGAAAGATSTTSEREP